MDDYGFQEIERISNLASTGQMNPNAAILAIQDAARCDNRLVVNFYLSKLAIDDLVAITTLAERQRKRSDKLADWLIQTVDDEVYRRSSLEGDRPQEATRPHLTAATRWTGDELGGALEAITLHSYVTRNEAVGTFIDK